MPLGISIIAAGLLSGCLGVSGAGAQEKACGLQNIQQTASLVYPPIGRAAHVRGTVDMLVTFAQDGLVTAVRPLAGPSMLRPGSEAFVRAFRANPYPGSRECPIAITFRLTGMPNRECSPQGEKPAAAPVVESSDPQHYAITHNLPCVVTMYSQAS